MVVLILVIAGGRNNDVNVEDPIPQTTNPVENDPIEMPPMDIEEPEDTVPPTKPEAEELSMGSVLSTDFVEINFTEVIVERDIQKAVTIDNVTRITGPDPIDGQKYICLSGTIVNTSTEPLPVYDFFVGRFELDAYTYEVTANDCDILSANGDPESMIDPLMEYEIRIYKAIPDALAEQYSTSSFTFGFYDGFDNKDLSYNKSFAEDPVAECPYQYFIAFQ